MRRLSLLSGRRSVRAGCATRVDEGLPPDPGPGLARRRLAVSHATGRGKASATRGARLDDRRPLPSGSGAVGVGEEELLAVDAEPGDGALTGGRDEPVHEALALRRLHV